MITGWEVDSFDDEWEEDIRWNYGRGHGLVGNEPLDVGLDIGGIVEQAFHIYDTILVDGGEE